MLEGATGEVLQGVVDLVLDAADPVALSKRSALVGALLAVTVLVNGGTDLLEVLVKGLHEIDAQLDDLLVARGQAKAKNLLIEALEDGQVGRVAVVGLFDRLGRRRGRRSVGFFFLVKFEPLNRRVIKPR